MRMCSTQNGGELKIPQFIHITILQEEEKRISGVK